MSASQWQSKVVPAQISFLAIYNPSLGITDETFSDQVVFYYSRASSNSRTTQRRKTGARSARSTEDELREEENEKLRQIGLAQGMVDFARTFSNGKAVDSVETEKSRVVLHELEKGWWVLASIGLTRLPTASPAKSLSTETSTGPAIEYSSREVSPPALLIQQLLQAHYVFLLHHGPSLSDLFVKLSRDRFCGMLGRYWNRFARGWDVLLHGNPAVDVFSGMKLASGGELGMGVGEEDWGSGERAVLEDVVQRTEGLVDLVVARYGEPAPVVESDNAFTSESEALPWMGAGREPLASDGVIFGGVNGVTRSSLRSISLYMRQIYTSGEYAYGVADNPSRERRKRKRRTPPEPAKQSNGVPHASSRMRDEDPRRLRERTQAAAAAAATADTDIKTDPIDPKFLPKDNRPQVHDRVASHDHATDEPSPQVASHPGVPPPIVSAAEQALNKATQGAAERKDTQEPVEEEPGSTLGIPDQYMKYLTFGLSTLAKPSKQRPAPTRKSTTQSSATDNDEIESAKHGDDKVDDIGQRLEFTQLDPIPDGEVLQAKIAMQKRQENKGHFIIGLKGDLDVIIDEEAAETTDGSISAQTGGSRTMLRTLQVELAPAAKAEETSGDDSPAISPADLEMPIEREPIGNCHRLRVVVYIHRPFIFCFLFERSTESLSYSGFYKSLHRNLVPIHKALLSSTDVTKVAQRIEASHLVEASDTASIGTNRLPSRAADTTPIFDLLYDPVRLTVHTSIPNIPEPGTPAAEGIVMNTDKVSSVPWTRIEALNVHSQVLTTHASTTLQAGQLERTSKTSRGWWVVWMKLSASNAPAPETNTIAATSDLTVTSASTVAAPQAGSKNRRAFKPEESDMNRIAFLVRKAPDTTTAQNPSTSSRVASGLWSSFALRSSIDDKAGGASAGWGPAALAGGIGFDARSYVEGLLSLNR